MSTPLWMLFIAALLTILSKVPAMREMAKLPKGYDNRHPRAQQAQLTGAGARGLAAHQNTFEAFPLFAVGVVVAELFATGHWLASILSITFIVSRVLYIWLYVADLSTWRSVVWGIGFFASLGLLLSPLWT